MSKKRKIIIWSVSVLGSLILFLILFGYWFISLIPAPVQSREEMSKSLPSDLSYLSENLVEPRGKILTVVTSTDKMGETDKATGYELTELARAYYVFEANGFTVDVASPKGGNPPVVIDSDDMKEFDYAFMNDSIAQYKAKNTIPVAEVDASEYEAVYFVGGKGAMWDFPTNEAIKSIIREIYEKDKVIGAVCHGPAALVNVQLSDGSNLLQGKSVSSFTNKEELLLISDAREIFPFLLQDKLVEDGAVFDEGSLYLKQVSTDNNIVTGQNPWSTWSVAEQVVSQLGYEPKARRISAEENSVEILGIYESKGYSDARSLTRTYCEQDKLSVDREIIAVHGLLAIYQLRILKFIQLVRLLSFSNSFLD